MATRMLLLAAGALAGLGGGITALAASSCDVDPCDLDPDAPGCMPSPQPTDVPEVDAPEPSPPDPSLVADDARESETGDVARPPDGGHGRWNGR
jgi:hypothetical protein